MSHHHQRQSSRRRKVCLFGTSADPPTGEGGHLGIVRHLAYSSSSSFDFDEVRVLPVYRHMYGVS
jgi:nicotinic acid mononucleotide adenylyltransferase